MTETLEVNPISVSKTSESGITSLILKGTSSSDRDAGFCSGEDDLEVEDDVHSPTDASEDSVEVKVTPISSRNKRKCAEPRKVEEVPSGPLKKRIRFDVKEESQGPFRPWSVPARPIPIHPHAVPTSPPPVFHPVYGYQPLNQDEPLSLVKTREEPRRSRDEIRPKDFAKIKLEAPRVPPHPGVRPPSAGEIESEKPTSLPKSSPGFTVESLLKSPKDKPQKEQRNYKNMTRERRIEANARERTRVHTISAAFDTLRRAVPSYSHNQKLSKLSVLRIACSYILTLSRVAGEDYSADQSQPSLASCVDLVSRTIQTEGKLRKKKDE